MPTPQRLGVLLRLDGVLHTSDLPVQSCARHLAELLPADLGAPLIAGMRGFLENKPELVQAAGVDLSPAEDGYQAVDILGRAAGLDERQRAAARAASRLDLATSAWAVDPADGLADLLATLAGRAFVAVVAEPSDPAGSAVLDSLELGAAIERPAGAPFRPAIAALVGRVGAPERLLVIGSRWAGELSVAAAAGCTTALVDRYRLGRGSPTFRGTDLVELHGQIRGWLTGPVPASTVGATS